MNIQSVNFFNKFSINNQNTTNKQYLKPLPYDTVSFTGANINDYKTNYDTCCAFTIGRYKGAFSSPKGFGTKAITKYNELCEEIFPNGELNIKFRYDPEFLPSATLPNGPVITNSRAQVFKEWIDFLDNPHYKNMLGSCSGESKDAEEEIKHALDAIKDNSSLKLIILNSVTKDIKTNNKHIPPSINPYALAKTINELEGIPRNDAANFSFTNRYRQNQIALVLKRAEETATHEPKERKGMVEIFPCSHGNIKGIWVKIPSRSHNKFKFNENTKSVEIISHDNWCTKRDSYKGSACIEEGDFYVFLQQNKKKSEYKPLIGMALSGNKIFQIQRRDNDDVVDYNMLPLIDFIVKERGLEFDYQTRDDGIPAGRQIEITKRKKDKIEGTDITLEKAIENKDAKSILKYAGISYTVNDNGLLEIDKYTPKIGIMNNKVPPITFQEMGIDEYALLSQVEKINGRASFETSQINELPESLTTISGNVTARENQFSQHCQDRFSSSRWFFKNNKFVQNV